MMKNQVKDIKIFQGNAITDARYEMSVLEKQIVYMLLSLIKKEQRQEQQLTYKIHIKDIEKHSQKTITNYQVLREATKKLIGRVYEIWHKDQKQRNVLLQAALLSSAKYVEGTGSIEMTINNEIQPYLMDLAKGFTAYSLDYVLSLRSSYSQRIYELLSRFKDLGSWRIKVDEFRYILKIENKYTGYGMFKQKVIDIAQKELAEKTDISFTIKEVKKGRKVEELVFVINQKESEKSLEIEFNEDAILKNKLTAEFRLAEWQADNILKSFDRPTIHKTLFDIKMNINDGKVQNIGGYTNKIFTNLSLGK